MTEKAKNLYQRLHAVMEEISYVQKENKKVNNQYTFVSHDAVTAKVRGALVNHGVFASTTVTDFKQDGNRTVAWVDLTFTNIDKPDETLTIKSFGYGIDQQDKGPGKAVSYAVKYGLLKAFMLETGDDPERDNIDHKKEPAKKAAAKTELSPAAKKYQEIGKALTAAKTQEDFTVVWNDNLQHITAFPEDRQTILKALGNRFNADEDKFPGDMP